jgi:hypothetical protein
VKSKKARARRAKEEAEAQAKLDRVETYKDHFRDLLGMTIDDTAAESLVTPAGDPLQILPAQHDHIYQTPAEWANRVGRIVNAPHPLQARTPVSFAQQIAQAFATRPTAGMLAALTSRLTNDVATSQRVDSPAPPTTWPASRAEWNDLLTPGYAERLRLVETPLGRMTLETFEDMTIYGVFDPPEEEP